MFNFLNKNKARKQRVILWREDRKLVARSFPVKVGHLIDVARRRAWAIYHDELWIKRGTNEVYAVVNERDAMPPDILGLGKSRPTLSTIVTTIAKSGYYSALFEVPEKQAQDRQATLMRTMVLVVGIAFVLIAIFIAISSGAIDLSRIQASCGKVLPR
jgi:hypothetical protein